MSQLFWLLLTWGFKKHPKNAINKSSSLDDSSQFTHILNNFKQKPPFGRHVLSWEILQVTLKQGFKMLVAKPSL